MDINLVSNDIILDLENVSKSNPNERLPKEEQIRSRIYASLLGRYEHVCVERNYFPVERQPIMECDIWAKDTTHTIWLELKRCWSGKGWVNKPDEQRKSWLDDIEKLSKLSPDVSRYFLLLGIFDFDPSMKSLSRLPKLMRHISTFYPDQCKFNISRSYRWRDTCFTHLGLWVWHWSPDTKIPVD